MIPVLATAAEDNGSVGTDEEDLPDSHSTDSPAHCVADIEDIDVKPVATTSDSKESACTLSCGACAYASTCEDRKSTRLELQSHHDLVCRLLLEKKKNNKEKKDVNEQTICLTVEYVATTHILIAR